jgi:NADH-quinone oxidoreductase subunit C
MTDTTPETPEADSAAEATEVAPPLDRIIPADVTLARLAGTFRFVVFEEHEDGDVAHVPAADLVGFTDAARAAGYDVFIDLCGVDYLRRQPRFEVVVNLLSHTRRKRLRIRIGVDGNAPEIPSISGVFAGANFYERETYDLFGISFSGHPDLTRILMPDDWEGFPLRKDYSVGSVPVQFKGSHKAS